MIAFLDVDYREQTAVAACVVARAWTDETAVEEYVARVSPVEPYVPGQFYRRELPCLLAVIRLLATPPTTVVVDGYVWLGEEGEPGLGAHLFQALHEQVPVVGIAKTQFLSARAARDVFRPGSARPLHVTAVGLNLDEVVTWVEQMHGPHRIPSLLRRVDQLARS